MIVKKDATGNWPLFASLIIFGVVISVLFILSIAKNQGHLVYALDDPYIHMAIAKNFVQHGVWGITQYGFTSSTSSLLWTLLISLSYYIFGVNEITPFILNIMFAVMTIFIIYYIFRKLKVSPIYTFLVLMAIIFFTPIPTLIFTGMEHMMQIFLIILFAYISAQILSNDREDLYKYLLLVAVLVTMARYESLFLIFTVSILFILKKKYIYSCLLLMVSLIPVGIYGIISMDNGWFFLPNSLVLKSFYLVNNGSPSSIATIFNFVHYFIGQFMLNKSVSVLVLLGSLFLIFKLKNRKFWDLNSILLVIFILTASLHMLFAKMGFFYRYESYLVALGIFATSLELYKFLPENGLFYNLDKIKILRYLLSLFIMCLVVFTLADRGYGSLTETSPATNNIYEQQYQMSLFVNQFYSGDGVALNDIGLVNYAAGINCLDLYGLGSLQVAKVKKDGYYDSAEISKLVNEDNIKVVIIYDSWFKGGIPANWVKVGQWKIKNNVVCGDDIVSFYAVDPKDKDSLIKNLKTFSSQLPKDVEIKYIAKE